MLVETVPQPAGVTVQSRVTSLLPSLAITAVNAPEVAPSTTVVEAGRVSVTVIGLTVNLMLAGVMPGLMVEAAVMVAVHCDGRVAAGGV